VATALLVEVFAKAYALVAAGSPHDSRRPCLIVQPRWSGIRLVMKIRRIEVVLDYAKTRGWREGGNPARWCGHLDHLLPTKAKVKLVQHHPAVPWMEIGDLMAQFGQRQGVAALAVRFLVLTAARSGEVRGARSAARGRSSAAGGVVMRGQTRPALGGRSHKEAGGDPCLSAVGCGAQRRECAAHAESRS